MERGEIVLFKDSDYNCNTTVFIIIISTLIIYEKMVKKKFVGQPDPALINSQSSFKENTLNNVSEVLHM